MAKHRFNGLSHDRRQNIIWSNAGTLAIGPLGTNYSLVKFHAFLFKKMHSRMSSENVDHFASPSMR